MMKKKISRKKSRSKKINIYLISVVKILLLLFGGKNN